MLEKILSLTGDDLAQVGEVMLGQAVGRVPLIARIASHILDSGGKRLRPVLTLVSSRLCGYRGEDHIWLAAAVEFMHTATLLHDDVVDASALRRGVPTANDLWGNKESVLVGDFLLGRAFVMMVEHGPPEALRVLSRAASAIAEGEVMQMEMARSIAMTEEDYIQVAGAKTAELFAAACEVGAVISGAGSAERQALARFGMNLGIAFQMVDDALDYSGGERLGKSPGDDFKEGKVTLPVILACRKASEEEREFWEKMAGKGGDDAGFARAREIMERTGAIGEALAKAQGFAEAAKSALEIFPGSALKQALAEAVDFCVARSF